MEKNATQSKKNPQMYMYAIFILNGCSANFEVFSSRHFVRMMR